MREAPSLVIIEEILKAGGNVKAYDPIAIDESKRRIGDKIEYASDIYDATLDADALIVVTEWKEFRLPNWSVLKKTMNTPVVLDGRNIYDKTVLESSDFVYYGIGY
jgi:UDPglucose 6-dehydrogenase